MAEVTIEVTPDGPYLVAGSIELRDVDGTVRPTKAKTWLCRCGASQNKPFCDNTHITIGFIAPATVAEPQMTLETLDGGKLHIETTTNGSLHISGNFMLVNDAGETVYQGTDEWLCRCGSSANKPFCDSTHKKIGFVAE